MILIMKGFWRSLLEDKPPRDEEEAIEKWESVQEQCLAVIYLSCERDQKHLISEAETGAEAWEMLADTYASNDISNVMRMEEVFSKAKMTPGQTMGQWIAHVKGLASQLRELGVEVRAERVANRILNGLGSEYQGVKYGLKTRAGALTVEVVTHHLLTAEMELLEEKENMPKLTTSSATASVTPRGLQAAATYQVAQNAQHHGPHATAMTTTSTCPPCPSCTVYQCGSTHVTFGAPDDPASAYNIPNSQRTGPQRTTYHQNYRAAPYALASREPSQPSSLQCYHCNNFGHTANTCWVRFPHLKPQWMKDAEEWRRQKNASRVPQQHSTQTQPTGTQNSQLSSTTAMVTRGYHTARQTPPTTMATQSLPATQSQPASGGYQTSYQNPMFLGNASIADIQGFVGPTASGVDKHATSHATLAHLNGKPAFGKEYAYSIKQMAQLPQDKEEGG